MAASPSEIERFRKDPEKWRALMRQLIKFDRPALSDDLIDLIERVLPLTWLEEISYRQAEWLLGVRDKVKIVSTYRQFSLLALLSACHQNRFDFEPHNEEWIESMFLSGIFEFRLYEAKRIYALARRIGEVDQDEEAA